MLGVSYLLHSGEAGAELHQGATSGGKNEIGLQWKDQRYITLFILRMFFYAYNVLTSLIPRAGMI